MNASKQAVAKPSASREPGSPRAAASPPRSGLRSRLGNQNLQVLLRARLLQTRLTVSDPHDPFEREAESVADQVMRMPDASERTVARSPIRIQRACTKCQDELMQRSSGPAGDAPVVSDALEQSIGQLSGRGSPLPHSVRSFMEPRFNADFGAVRVHTDAHAHGLARAVNAQAFTVGNDVVFGAGHYSPHTDGGKRLLAHELTHVVQQGGAGKIARRIDFQDQRERPGAAQFEEDAAQLVRGVLKGAADAGIYVGAFLVGIVHGFLKSIWDAVSGIAHMLYSVFKSVFLDQTFMSDVKDLASGIMNLSWERIDDAITGWSQEWSKKLNSPSPFTAGEAHGYLTGYVMAEAAMLLLTGGTTAALKGAFWTSKVGLFVKGSAAMRTMQTTLTKAAKVAGAAGSEFGKAVEMLRQSRFGTTVKAAEIVGTGVLWTAALIGKVLALPEKIALSAAEKILANVRKLEPFFPRIRELSERAKRWLLGCNSPCDVDADGIVATLCKSSNAEVEALAAVPRAKNVELVVVDAPPPAPATELHVVDVPVKAKKKRKPKAEATPAPETDPASPAVPKLRPSQVRQAKQLELAEKLKVERSDLQGLMKESEDLTNRETDIRDRLIRDRKEKKLTPQEYAELMQKLDEVREELLQIDKLDDLRRKIEKLELQIANLGQDHYDRLSNASFKRKEYKDRRAPQIDEIFGTAGGVMEIDHCFPRSKIAAKEGFYNLSIKHQIWIFNLQENLVSMPGPINNARRDIPYARWDRKVWSTFPAIQEWHIQKLAELEARMERLITAMIRNPSLIPDPQTTKVSPDRFKR